MQCYGSETEKIIWSIIVAFIVNCYCIFVLILNKTALEIKSVLVLN